MNPELLRVADKAFAAWEDAALRIGGYNEAYFLKKKGQRYRASYLEQCRQMAMSPEGIAAFAGLVDDPNASILECGAGYSSYVLRKLFDNVHTCDSDPLYLNRVMTFCRSEGFTDDRWYVGLPSDSVADYVLYDYDSILDRPAGLEAAWNCCLRLMYCDDADTRPAFRDYRQHVVDFGISVGARVEDCEHAYDRFGRWGVILHKA